MRYLFLYFFFNLRLQVITTDDQEDVYACFSGIKDEVIKKNKEKEAVSAAIILKFLQKCVLWREGETFLFLNFNITISHMFPKNYIETAQIVQKI